MACLPLELRLNIAERVREGVTFGQMAEFVVSLGEYCAEAFEAWLVAQPVGEGLLFCGGDERHMGFAKDHVEGK